MINYLHYLLHRPEKGFDPVPADYAARYAEIEWSHHFEKELAMLEDWAGPLAGRTVLDLGAGPGQVSAAFAKIGAHVTWYDISRNYQRIAEKHASELDLTMEFAVGYLDDARRVLKRQFDFIYNRICWNYSMADHSFAKAIFDLMAPGGFAYLDIPTTASENTPRGFAGMCWHLYRATGIKIGHPFPPPKRIEKMFARFPELAVLAISSSVSDRIYLRKDA